MGWRELGLALAVSATAGCFSDAAMSGGGDGPPADTDDGGPTTKGDTGPDSGSAGTTGDTSATTEDGSTSDDDSDGGSTGGEAVCGDGVLEGDEECEPSVDLGCTSLCVPQGTRVWLTLLDDVLDDEGSAGQDLLVGADGTIVVAAHQLAYAANVQAVVAHLDADGAVTATQALPGDGHTMLHLSELDARHHVLAHEGFDPWLAQLDGAGGMAWREDYTHDESFEAYGIASDGTQLYAFFLDALQGQGLTPTLRALDGSGAEQWNTTFAGHFVRPMLAASAQGVFVNYGVGEAEVDTVREICHVTSAGVSSGCFTFDLDAEVTAMHVADDTIYVAGFEVRDGQSSWVVAAFGTDGQELWRTKAFEDAETDRHHQAHALTTTPDGQLIVAGSARGRGGDIEAAWAAFDASNGYSGATWTDDELGAVRNVEMAADGTLVSAGSMPLAMFPKPVFITKQLL